MLCVTAAQRAGTTALDSALGATGLFKNFGEILQIEADHQAGNFFAYSKKAQLTLDFMREPKTVLAVIEDYFKYLNSLATRKIPLLDVKLNSWQVLRHAWSYPFEEPLLMRALKDKNAAFVFILRRDLTGQVLSEFIARRSQKWHDLQNSDLPPSFAAPVELATHRALQIIRTEKLMFGLLHRYPKSLFIAYEELYDDHGIAPRVIDFLRANFEVKMPDSINIPIRKNEGDKQSVISNYNEVDSAIRQLSNEWDRLRL